MRVLKIGGWLLVILSVLASYAWFSGRLTPRVTSWLQNQLPYDAGAEFRIDRYYYSDDEPDDNGRIFFTIDADRVKRAVGEASFWAFLLPPGLIRDGMVIEGAWVPTKRDDETREKKAMGVEIPVGIAVRDTPGGHPALAGKLPTQVLTRYIAVEFEEDFIEEREEWELGHYAYAIEPEIVSCSIRTTNAIDLSPAEFSRPLYLVFRARASVKMELEENIGTFDADGSLYLLAYARLHFREMDDGLSPRYRAEVEDVDANIRGMNNAIDDEISDKLRNKWHRSLNKEKRKNRLAEKRLPSWFPTDVAIDIRFLDENL